jgi:hypothetical protein
MIPRQPHRVLEEIEAFCGLPASQYPKANEAVFQGPMIEFPPEVVAHLKERLSDQTLFLERKFGAEFLAESRGDRE